MRDHRRLLAGDVPEGPHVLPRHARLQGRVAGDDRGGREVQRAGPVHRLHRLRVDVQHRGQQPPPQRRLPRQRRQGQPGRAVHRLSALRQRQPGRPVEVDGRLREEDRRQRPRHRAQRQPEQRPDVPRGRGLREDARPRVRRDAREVGAALRGDADEGHRGVPPLPLAERRVRRLRALGQGQPRRQRRQEEGDARVRVRPLGPQERPEAGAAARDEPLQVRPDRLERRAHRARRHGGGQLLRQDHPAGAEPRAPDRHVHRTTRRPA